jgi:hypothetical protein
MSEAAVSKFLAINVTFKAPGTESAAPERTDAARSDDALAVQAETANYRIQNHFQEVSDEFALPGTNEEANDPLRQGSAFSEQLEHWIAELAKQAAFAHWRQAEREVYPLGPGTHSWVVLLQRDGQSVGYLLIGALEDGGYALLEYGLGSSPLFSRQTLQQSLALLGYLPAASTDPKTWSQYGVHAEPLYRNAMQAVWKVSKGETVLYLDAVTGETLPIEAWPEDVPPAPSRLSTEQSIQRSGARLTRQLSLPSFDPYATFPWMTDEPLALREQDDIAAWFSAQPQAQLVYVIELYNRSVLYALPVTGYHQWDGNRVYLAIEQDGTRWIPFAAMLAFGGSFYLQPADGDPFQPI